MVHFTLYGTCIKYNCSMVQWYTSPYIPLILIKLHMKTTLLRGNKNIFGIKYYRAKFNLVTRNNVAANNIVGFISL